jgi:hypothetical protein
MDVIEQLAAYAEDPTPELTAYLRGVADGWALAREPGISESDLLSRRQERVPDVRG